MEQDTPKFKSKKKQNAWLTTTLIVVISLLVAALGVGAFFGGWFQSSTGDDGPSSEGVLTNDSTPQHEHSDKLENLTPDQENESKGVYTFLVAGLDAPQKSKNTDVLMLASFDTNTGKINILQLYRDLFVEDPLLYGNGKSSGDNNKINNVFACAYNDYMRKNPKATKDEAYHYGMTYLCSKMYSLFAVKPDHYVYFDVKMYEELLKLVAPITVDVPFNMDYDDGSQGLHIHLKKGRQQLNASQAVQFSRFRQSNSGLSLTEGALGRNDLQKRVIAAIAEKLLTNTSLPQVQAVAGNVLKNLKTDLSLEDLVWFMNKALTLYSEGTLSLDTITLYDLPCYAPSPTKCFDLGYNLAYGFLEKDNTLKLIQNVFNPTSVVLTEDDLHFEEPFSIDYCDRGGKDENNDGIPDGITLQQVIKNPPKVLAN